MIFLTINIIWKCMNGVKFVVGDINYLVAEVQ